MEEVDLTGGFIVGEVMERSLNALYHIIAFLTIVKYIVGLKIKCFVYL